MEKVQRPRTRGGGGFAILETAVLVRPVSVALMQRVCVCVCVCVRVCLCARACMHMCAYMSV